MFKYRILNADGSVENYVIKRINFIIFQKNLKISTNIIELKNVYMYNK